jgi:phospholipase C
VSIEIINSGQQTVAIELVDLSYNSEPQTAELAAGASKTFRFDGERSFGWYDLKLQVAGREHFVRRWAGRVETGRPSFSDPAMGKPKP